MMLHCVRLVSVGVYRSNQRTKLLKPLLVLGCCTVTLLICAGIDWRSLLHVTAVLARLHGSNCCRMISSAGHGNCSSMEASEGSVRLPGSWGCCRVCVDVCCTGQYTRCQPIFAQGWFLQAGSWLHGLQNNHSTLHARRAAGQRHPEMQHAVTALQP
jgi:hypothetical protein